METHSHALSFSVRRGLGLVSDQDVDVRQELVKGDLEELGDEGSAQVESDDLSSTGSGLSDFHGGFDTVGQEETTNVEEFGVVDVFLDFGLGEVRGGELFGGSESGDEGSDGSEGFSVMQRESMDTQTYRSWPVKTTAQAPVFSSSTTW